MNTFITDNFILRNDISQSLYDNYARDLPIIDYHCHINPEDIARDIHFTNISDLWFSGDHYKWRLLRSAGIDEEYITGSANPKEKFLAWAGVIGKSIGNPLYHWTCLELARFFDILEPLTEKNAEAIWDKTCKMISNDPERYSARRLISDSKVELLCTTDDPIDDLRWHKMISSDSSFTTKVLPTFRPDLALDIEKEGFCDYLIQLGAVSGVTINNLDDYFTALDIRIDYFASNGCKLADHGMEHIYYEEASHEEVDAILKKRFTSPLALDEIAKFKTFVLAHCASRYQELNWTMQLHFGCIRDVNSLRLSLLGNNCGCDSISGAYNFVTPLSKLLSKLSATHSLPSVILYSLNPNDNILIDTLIGCFQESGVTMKLQHGSAWWFNDNYDGMINQLKSLSSQSFLPGFVGMLTDSRSFLSYTRHEYFRRILCNFIGEQVSQGLFPYDKDILRDIIEGICYKNAREIFERT